MKTKKAKIPKPKSNKQKLLEFIQNEKIVRTSDVIRWGVRNYCNRSERDARLLAQSGKIRRITDKKQVAELLGRESVEAIWVWGKV